MTSLVNTVIFFLLLGLTFTGILKIRTVAIGSIVSITLSTLFIMVGLDNVSEFFAIIGYLFLADGVVYEAVSLFVEEKRTRVTLPKVVEQKVNVEKIVLSLSVGLLSIGLIVIFWFFLPKINFPSMRLSFPQLYSPKPPKQELIAPVREIPDTPTPEPIDGKALAILIKNGTLINGLASKSAEILRKKGYQTVEIGNSDKRDYTKWILYYSDSLKAAADIVKEDLGVKSITLEEKLSTESADIVIIAGSEK